MCLIVMKPSILGEDVIEKGEKIHKDGPALLTEKFFTDMLYHHPHGLGLMWGTGKKVRLWHADLVPYDEQEQKPDWAKGHANTLSVSPAGVEAAYKLYKQLDEAGHTVVIHWRFATSGIGEHQQANMHPFYVAGKGEKLAFCHNGVINDVSLPKDGTLNDTRVFNEYLMGWIHGDWRKNQLLWDLLKKFIGYQNKLVFMDHLGRVDIMNEAAGTWEHGIWYSNTTFRQNQTRIGRWLPGTEPKRKFFGIGRGNGGHGSRVSDGAASSNGLGLGGRKWGQQHTTITGQTYTPNNSTCAIKISSPAIMTLCRQCFFDFGNDVVFGGCVPIYAGEQQAKGMKCELCGCEVLYCYDKPREGFEAREKNLGLIPPVPTYELTTQKARTIMARYLAHAGLALQKELDCTNQSWTSMMEAAFALGICDLKGREKSLMQKFKRARENRKEEADRAIYWLGLLSQSEYVDMQDNDTGISAVCWSLSVAFANGKELSQGNWMANTDVGRIFRVAQRRIILGAYFSGPEDNTPNVKKKEDPKQEAAGAACDCDGTTIEQSQPETAVVELADGRIVDTASGKVIARQEPAKEPTDIRERIAKDRKAPATYHGDTMVYEDAIKGNFREIDKKLIRQGMRVLFSPDGSRMYYVAKDEGLVQETQGTQKIWEEGSLKLQDGMEARWYENGKIVLLYSPPMLPAGVGPVEERAPEGQADGAGPVVTEPGPTGTQ